jgi:hypothetical protein
VKTLKPRPSRQQLQVDCDRWRKRAKAAFAERDALRAKLAKAEEENERLRDGITILDNLATILDNLAYKCGDDEARWLVRQVREMIATALAESEGNE